MKKFDHCFNTIIIPVKNSVICQGTAKNIEIISLLFSSFILEIMLGSNLDLILLQKPNGRVIL